MLLLSLSPWLPLPLSGCTADRTLPPSPTTYAATPPASAPPPPPPSSSASCCLSSHSPSCASLHFRQSPRLQIAIRRPVAQDAVRCLHQQPPHQHVPGLADPQLRLALPAVPLLPRQSQVRPYVPAVLEALRIFQRQDDRSTRSASPLHSPASAAPSPGIVSPSPGSSCRTLRFVRLISSTLFNRGRITLCVASLSPSARDSFT